MKESNPFSLMYGRAPYSLITRPEQYEQIISTFNNSYPSTFAYLITGIRGSGKTVMLRSIYNELSKLDDWITIDVNSQGSIIKDLSEKLLIEGKKFNLFLNWSICLNAKIFSLQINNQEIITNPEIIFERLLKKANENNKKVLITIDEVTPSNEIKKFANFYQSMIGKNYNLFLLMTGLKNNINSLIGSNTSSFLSRTPKINLTPLNEISIAKEYERILKIDFQLSVTLSKLTKGYAFAYQVLGYLFFESDKKEINDALLKNYDKYLQDNGYNIIWKDLTNKEQNICFAISDSKNKETKEIMNLANMKESNFQNYRNKLIEKEIISPTGYGKVDFTLPRFNEFVHLMKFFR